MRHELEYLAVRSVASAVRVMSPRHVRDWGSRLGLAYYGIDRAHRRIALANLAAAFPARSPEERRTLARQVFGHFGRTLLELLKFTTLSDDRKMELVEWDGEDRVRLAYAQGRGVLFCTGHFGCWEQQSIAHALKFEPMAVLARPLDNPKLHAMLEQVRTCTGNSVIYRRGAVRRVMRLLAAGHGVGILIDQHMISPDAVYVDFFGRPASTTSTLAALALRTGAPVVPLFALPLPDGRYRMIYEHPVEPPRADAPDAVRDFTQRCTDVLEMYVRRHPELWLWMHRRWRGAAGPALDQAPGMFPTAKQDVEADT
jgi:Kdo2-lipid IVA lauroyltransferase/acyltransferase